MAVRLLRVLFDLIRTKSKMRSSGQKTSVEERKKEEFLQIEVGEDCGSWRRWRKLRKMAKMAKIAEVVEAGREEVGLLEDAGHTPDERGEAEA